VHTGENGRAHDAYTAVYTSRYGPYTVYGRVRSVYTARPLYGCVRAVFAGEDGFTGRVHGGCNGRTTRYTAVYTAVYTTRYMAVYTARTRPHNCR